MLTFDAHLDLSLNGVEYGRDLRLSIEEIRSNESGMTDLGGRQRSTVCFPEMRKAGVGLCVATQLAGCMKPASPVMNTFIYTLLDCLIIRFVDQGFRLKTSVQVIF